MKNNFLVCYPLDYANPNSGLVYWPVVLASTELNGDLHDEELLIQTASELLFGEHKEYSDTFVNEMDRYTGDVVIWIDDDKFGMCEWLSINIEKLRKLHGAA